MGENITLLVAFSGGLLSFLSPCVLPMVPVYLAAMKLPRLNYEKRLNLSAGGTTGYLRSFTIGAVFSVTWTACVGPILGSILTMATAQATAWQGAYLLAIYSLGVGLPVPVWG